MSELTKAFLAAWAEFPQIARDAENPHFKSRYTTLDEMIRLTRPVLSKYGLRVITTLTEDSDGSVITSHLAHVSGEVGPLSTLRLRFDRDNMQGLGSALTYARRYLYANELQIASEDDDDGNASVPKTSKTSNPYRDKANAQRSKTPAVATPPTVPEPITTKLCPPRESWESRIAKCSTPAELLKFVRAAREYAPLQADPELWRDVATCAGGYAAVRVNDGRWEEAASNEVLGTLKSIMEFFETEDQSKEAFGDG